MNRASIAGAVGAALALTAPAAADGLFGHDVCAGEEALALTAPAAAADPEALAGRTVAEVRFFRDGRPFDDPSLLDFIETRPGQPLSMRQVRESLTHLFSLGDVVDVRVSAAPAPQGVSLRYDLAPLRAAGGVEVLDALGRPIEEAADLIRRRVGAAVSPERVAGVAALLGEYYRDAGRFAARITPRPPGADGRLVIDVDPGPRARIDRIAVLGVGPPQRAAVLNRLGVQEGAVYDPAALDRRLAEYQDEVRSRRFYAARFSHAATPSPDGLAVSLELDVRTGLQVAVRFDRDPVLDARVDELVPIAREGSIDEDLLEDSSLRITAHLQGLGYRDARVSHRRLEEPGQLSIMFSVERGARYVVDAVEFTGNLLLPAAELAGLFDVTAGAPLVVDVVEAGAAAVRAAYERRGYRDVDVRPRVVEAAPPDAAGGPAVVPARQPAEAGDDGQRPDAAGGPAVVPVRLVVDVVEGPATTVGVVSFEGATAFSEADLAAAVAVRTGMPFHAPQARVGASAILLRYLNEGYETAEVDVSLRFDESGENADVTFLVREGPRIFVDHVLVVGNRQISTSTIRRELALRAGEPLGRDEIDETRRRLTALGVFRRVELREFSHGPAHRRDVVVMVEEAPATRIGYGGGLEASQRLRATAGGAAAERLEFAPRGFFEIGRRNLWGNNRSIDLYTRVSLWPKGGGPGEVSRTNLGLNEYRFLLNYREPRVLRQSADLFVSGFAEQVIRPSFDLIRQGVNTEFRQVIGSTMTGRVGYTYGVNRITNEQLRSEDRPLVDRLFPEVTLSTFSAGLVRDTRTDPLEPTAGTLLAVDVEAASRRVGSAVGYAKTVLQGFVYRRLPGEAVFAAGARLGLARSFTETFLQASTLVLTDGGAPMLREVARLTFVHGLPASERFFAGGDSTVRGFALDRLGDESTIGANGFPTGGNAMIVLNSELRMPVFGPLQVVGFLDAGNVIDRVGNFDLARIRGAAGFGVRYRSPLGPIRLDLGFKLDRQEFAGERERLTALHLSIGQAF